MIVLYDLLNGFGQSIVLILIALVIGLIIKKPISLWICILVSAAFLLVYILILGAFFNWFGAALVLICSFLFVYLIPRRRSVQQISSKNINENENRED